MYGLTTLGIIHTLISLIAVGAGLAAFIRHREIAFATGAGRLYFWTTVLTCLTGFGIFQHGGFGVPHALGAVTLITLGIALAAEKRPWFGRRSRTVMVIAYSTSFFFHIIPGFTETATRLPMGMPLAAGPEDPVLQAAIGSAFLVFLIGLGLQLFKLRSTRAAATA